MTVSSTKTKVGWFRERMRRHLSELARLSAPVIMMRVGILGLGLVDTAMVGHYATQHLAWLNLANQSIIMFALVVGVGLLSGIMVYSAAAVGEENYNEAGRVWRRTLPFSVTVGLALVVVIWPAEFWLAILGQTAPDAEAGGALIQILALGLPGHLLFLNCTMFLEGIKRGDVGFYLMVCANVVNVFLNYMLIFGYWGAPELGAEGSAWASTLVRWFMAISALSFVWWSPSLKPYNVRKKHGQKWKDWIEQRQLGYASAVSLAAEITAFSALAIFAGWLGTVPLAAHGVAFQVIGFPLMIAVGIGVASTVRVGIAFARKDQADAALASIAGVLLNFIFVGVLGAIMYYYVPAILGLFTNDDRIIDLLVPITLIFTVGMLLDASQMVTSLALRGYKETWWPTALQAFSFSIVMLPCCYLLAFSYGMGLRGLMLGTLIGVSVSFLLQLMRLYFIAKRPIE